MATQRMLIPRRWEQRLDGAPENINHFGSRARMMMKSSTWSSVLGSHPASKPGQPDDRWMVTYPRESFDGSLTGSSPDAHANPSVNKPNTSS
jgi:hypothetical protein